MLTISRTASRHLETWLNEVMGGELELWQLPAPVAAFYQAGFNDGIAANSQTQRIKQLEHECDRLYMAAFTPKQRHDLLLKRQQRADAFLWPLFESALLNIINRTDVAPGAEAERNGTTRGRQAA
ncbi:hypothetical protein [Leucobacter chinensis]|uniref:hypothetical protein n=1 Tax=Leucobacter chinensis TaxID=2851010 RepID=UPI001C2257C5|nr:hypothetical protein [Leucobacter chinensis]